MRDRRERVVYIYIGKPLGDKIISQVLSFCQGLNNKSSFISFRFDLSSTSSIEDDDIYTFSTPRVLLFKSRSGSMRDSTR